MFTHIDNEIIWPKIHAVRHELYNYLAELNAGQWDTESLCDGWRVRDVVAHLILEFSYTASHSWFDYLKSGMSTNKFLKRTAIQLGQSSPDILLSKFKAIENDRRVPKAVPPVNALVDLLVHEQDIRVSLNHAQDMDRESLRLIFSHWEPSAYNFGEKITGIADRVKDTKFVILDLNITKGDGLEVIGNAQDILMSIAGRKLAISRLSGVGAATLQNRLYH